MLSGRGYVAVESTVMRNIKCLVGSVCVAVGCREVVGALGGSSVDEEKRELENEGKEEEEE